MYTPSESASLPRSIRFMAAPSGGRSGRTPDRTISRRRRGHLGRRGEGQCIVHANLHAARPVIPILAQIAHRHNPFAVVDRHCAEFARLHAPTTTVAHVFVDQHDAGRLADADALARASGHAGRLVAQPAHDRHDVRRLHPHQPDVGGQRIVAAVPRRDANSHIWRPVHFSGSQTMNGFCIATHFEVNHGGTENTETTIESQIKIWA